MTDLIDLTIDAVADVNGEAVARFNGPGMSFDQLRVDAIATTSSSAALPNVTLYRGSPMNGRRLAFNADGRSGHFKGGGIADYIGAGDVWTVQWSSCTPGSVCQATLTGVVERKGAR